jgi:hypothetical protein
LGIVAREVRLDDAMWPGGGRKGVKGMFANMKAHGYCNPQHDNAVGHSDAYKDITPACEHEGSLRTRSGQVVGAGIVRGKRVLVHH